MAPLEEYIVSLFRTDIIQLVATNKSDFDFLWWEGKKESDSPEEKKMVDVIRDNLALAMGIPPSYLEYEHRIELDHYIISYKNMGTIHVSTRGNYNRWERCRVL